MYVCIETTGLHHSSYLRPGVLVIRFVQCDVTKYKALGDKLCQWN